MKIQVTQENLNKAVGAVARVAISARNPLPILNNILLRTVDNRLTISSTNLEIAITEHIGAKVIHDGAITVPARLFMEFIASLSADTIEIEAKDHKVHITAGGHSSTINGMLADDFPVVPHIEDGQRFSLPARELKKALQQVLVAASGDETRPILTGVYIHTFEGELYLVATDSYRLSERKLLKTTENINLIVPSSALNDLLRLIGDSGESVEVTCDSQQVVFKIGESELVSRLIDGTYPDYRKLIPKAFHNTATVSKDDFVNITKVSSLFARESAGSITIKTAESDSSVTIKSVASQLGENTSHISGEVSGDGEVTINSKYLLDALNIMPVKKLSFSFNGKIEPCVLRSEESADFLHVIMPLKS